MIYYDEALSYFRVAKQGKDTSQAYCPIHNNGNEKKPSLTLSRRNDNGLLLYCHVCGKQGTESILNAVGLKYSDIMPPKEHNKKTVKEFAEYPGKHGEYAGRKLVAQYSYFTTGGKYCYSKCRIREADGGKTFKYCITDSLGLVDKYTVKNRQSYAALYPFMEITEARKDNNTILYCEGEKDADNAIYDGFHAVTAGSANDWTSNLVKHFEGLTVIIVPDQDEPGFESALRIMRDLLEKKIDVQGIQWPDTFTKAKGDYTDFIESFEDRQQGVAAFRDLMKNALLPPFFNDYATRVIKRLSENPPADGPLDLMQFHKIGKEGEPTGVYDYQILKYLTRNDDIKVLGGVPYIYEHGVFIPDVSGARLKTMIAELIFPEFLRYQTIDRIYKLILSTYSLQIETKQLNDFPLHWVNFKNGFYDPLEKKMIPHDRKYLAVNQIPHDFEPDAVTSGPIMDEWLDFIAPDPENMEMLLEYCGYCMTTDTRQQKCLILYGIGGSGKSTLIKLLEYVIGLENISNIPLATLNKQFASFGLLGKLLNSCADLETKALDDASLVKQVMGEDTIRGEAKGKNAIFFKHYAKMIFSTNEIPTVLNERTDGFYRKLMIIPIDKKPVKKDPELFAKLKAESDHFIHLCMDALHRLHRRGVILESHDSLEEVRRAWIDSDSVQAFIDNCCQTDDPNCTDCKEPRTVFYEWYQIFCMYSNRTPLQNTAFFGALRVKNFKERKINGIRHFLGIEVDSTLMAEVIKEFDPVAAKELNTPPAGDVRETLRKLRESYEIKSRGLIKGSRSGRLS